MLEKFHFTTDSGAEITMPRQDQLPVGIIRKSRKLDQGEQVWTFIEHVADEDNLSKIDALTIDEFQRLVTEWTDGDDAEGEASLGESEQSPKPSTTP